MHIYNSIGDNKSTKICKRGESLLKKTIIQGFRPVIAPTARAQLQQPARHMYNFKIIFAR